MNHDEPETKDLVKAGIVKQPPPQWVTMLGAAIAGGAIWMALYALIFWGLPW